MMAGRNRSPAQDAATARNWRIRCIRALYAQCGILGEGFRGRAEAAIDAQLMALGAETQTARRERTRAEATIRAAEVREDEPPLPF